MNLEVTIFGTDLVPIGLVNQMTSLRWTERFHSFGDFELWCPLTPDNAEMLKQENLIWIGTESVGVIETIQKKKDNEGSLSLQVSGRFIECWLERRIVLPRYIGRDYVSNLMRGLVNANAVNPTLSARKLPHIVLGNGQAVLGPVIDYSVHRDNLWETLNDLGKVNDMSPRLTIDVPTKKLSFVVRKSTDRSIEQTAVPFIALSSELSDILSSEYSSDFTGWKTTATVAGAGEGASRKEYTVENQLSGLNRREVSVDARDISDMETWDMELTISKQVTDIHYHRVYDENDNYIGKEPYEWKYTTTETKVLTHPKTHETRTIITSSYEWLDEEPEPSTTTQTGQEEVEIAWPIYSGMLAERGKSYLSDNLRVEAFNSQVRMTGARAYTYGEDYFLGDRITVQDFDLKIQMSTTIEEVEQTWDEESYSVVLTLGKDAPTIKQLINKRR